MSKGKQKKEWVRYHKLSSENSKLKKEVSRLRRVINQFACDPNEKDKIQEYKHRKQEHVCEQCGNEGLQHLEITRPDGEFKVDLCQKCGHRSTLKKNN